jgi:hypothetical protein
MNAQAATRAATALLEQGSMADAWTRQHGEVGTAIPVEAPKGVTHAWFVPVPHEERLLGFFELTLDLYVRRYSSFQKRECDMNGCPPAADWIDPETVRRKVLRHLNGSAVTGEPYLSFDRYPSRLAWAVPITLADGGSRVMFVAGDAVFEGQS